MTSKEPAPALRDQAVALRRAGRSRREIKQLLGISSNATLDRALAGEPPPAWTERPRAKDALRARSRVLRAEGLDYGRIATELGVSKSSVSLWVRDLPRPQRLSYEECRQRAAEGTRRYWEAERTAREARREATRAVAAAEIGQLTQREMLIAGAIAYWCEGGKSKPHYRRERVQFINSDPRLIVFFLSFLDVAGVRRDQVRYRIHIHVTADVSAAQTFWMRLTRAPTGQFLKPTLKRHNPATPRHNLGQDYHGCLCVTVQQSAELYRRIEGWARASMSGVTVSGTTAPGQVHAEAISSAELRGRASLPGIVDSQPWDAR